MDYRNYDIFQKTQIKETVLVYQQIDNENVTATEYYTWANINSNILNKRQTQ